MAINKVTYGNNTLLDVSQTTAIDSYVNEGFTFVDKDGSHKTGTQPALTTNDLTVDMRFLIPYSPIPPDGYIHNPAGHPTTYMHVSIPINSQNIRAENIKYGTPIGFYDVNTMEEIVGTYTGECPYLQATAEETDVYHGKTFIEHTDGTLSTGTLGTDSNVTATDVRHGVMFLDCAGDDPVYRSGTMEEHSQQDIGLTQVSGQSIDSAYYDNCTVSLSAENQALLIPGNIRSGVRILGVDGEFRGNLQAGKSAYADTIRARAIYPDEGFTGLEYLLINPIPTEEVPNEYGTTFIWG